MPFEYAGLTSGNVTYGLRFHEPEQLQVNKPQDYFYLLQEQGIILDVAERQNTIRAQVEKLAFQVRGLIVPDEGLLAEVANLVETPTAFSGSFDAFTYGCRSEVVISVMQEAPALFRRKFNHDRG